jgi:DNA adenine methylase
MAGLLRDIRRLNGLGHLAIAEPFGGGAGASLALLYREEVHRIHINDADPAIYDFWWTVVNRPDEFLSILSKTRASVAEWRRQRDVYRTKVRRSRLHRAFSVFYLNRCNRSGIIMNGGPIGGIAQTGKWKINARFNKGELRRRFEKIAEYRGRIEVSCEDGIRLIERLDSQNTFFFIDPPYFKKGPTLYLNGLDNAYHATLAAQLRALHHAAWVLTYDDCPEVRRMYRDWAMIRPYSVRYSASERRLGKEVAITPRWMRLPSRQLSAVLVW